MSFNLIVNIIRKGKSFSTSQQYLAVAIFAIPIMTIPLIAGAYPNTVMIEVAFYSIVTMGIVMLMGFAGQISLGHGALFGCGAYFSAILTTRCCISPWPALFLAAGLTGAIAFAVGRAMFRMHGLILAGVTLALNLLFFYLVSSLSDLTGGAMGMMNIPPLSLAGYTSQSILFNYYLLWTIAVLLLIFSLNLTDSRFGRALRSINTYAGGSEEAALVLGVDITKYKVWVFVLSAVYASIAGSIYAHYTRIIEPNTFMLQFSALVALMAIIGGRSSPWGAFLGAGLIVGIRQLLGEFIPVFVGGPTGSYELIAYGVILVLALLFLPRGLFPVVKKVFVRGKPINNES
ncbi:MAG: branched-chain amino acid ABC transporter permease [Dehalococcoidales bacterium]